MHMSCEKGVDPKPEAGFRYLEPCVHSGSGSNVSSPVPRGGSRKVQRRQNVRSSYCARPVPFSAYPSSLTYPICLIKIANFRKRSIHTGPIDAIFAIVTPEDFISII